MTATTPSSANRDTTLNVQVVGSGFDQGSAVSFELNGAVDPRVHVNSTSYVKSTQLLASVTIAADAVVASYNVGVRTGSGKKGIGTELFAVTYRPTVLTGGDQVTSIGFSGEMAGKGPSGNSSCSVSVLPILWRPDGSKVSLPLGPYCGGEADAINQSGVILGRVYGTTPSTAALWVPSGADYSLQVLGATADGKYPSFAGGLTDATELVGWSPGPKIYWWSAATGWLQLQLPAGATACLVNRAINNAGAIVASCSIGGRARDGYYWSSRTATPVLLPRPTATGDITPYDINDNGVIVAYGAGSPGRAVRWIPDGSGGWAVSLLPDVGLGSGAYAVASDGTVSGFITTRANSPQPALWPPAGGYQLLGLPKSVRWGEAYDVAVTSVGILSGGTGANLGALRWSLTP